jgi:hypothetical protein
MSMEIFRLIKDLLFMLFYCSWFAIKWNLNLLLTLLIALFVVDLLSIFLQHNLLNGLSDFKLILRYGILHKNKKIY